VLSIKEGPICAVQPFFSALKIHEKIIAFGLGAALGGPVGGWANDNLGWYGSFNFSGGTNYENLFFFFDRRWAFYIQVGGV